MSSASDTSSRTYPRFIGNDGTTTLCRCQDIASPFRKIPGPGATLENAGHDAIDRRMDMNHDGSISQDDFNVWQSVFISWQQGRK